MEKIKNFLSRPVRWMGDDFTVGGIILAVLGAFALVMLTGLAEAI